MRARDIEAANGNFNAVFTASEFRLWGDQTYYRLGVVDIPAAPVDVRSKLQAYDGGPRRLLIKWKDLGSPLQVPGPSHRSGTHRAKGSRARDAGRLHHFPVAISA